MALLSEELFGDPLTLPEMPKLKGIRGLGMSDSPQLAARLEEKFDYINTYYHQSPRFDITHPDATEEGRYDFVICAEVLEHVPPPVERAFATLYRILKPDGVLVMSTPCGLSGEDREHFPDLHEYTLASLGSGTVLVNRRRDGKIEVLEDLVFHGGPGSTLELRLFMEPNLRQMLSAVGFHSIRYVTDTWPEFGAGQPEPWSLPIAARKGNFSPNVGDFAREYRAVYRQLQALQVSEAELRRELERRTEWALGLERANNRYRARLERKFWFRVRRRLGMLE